MKVYARGWCRNHYKAWWRFGSTEGYTRPQPDERFWALVEKTDGCWLWTAATSRGYGRFHVEFGKPMVQAHRWAYENTVGPVPAGLELDHLCRVRTCVRPDHLEPVTHRENGLRGESPAAIHARQTHCVHGHEYTPENTYVRVRNGTRHGRECRTCIQARGVSRVR